MSNLTCVICTDLLSQTNNIFVTICGHMFHYECLSQWLMRSQSCPQCRKYCTTANIHRVFLNLDTSKIRSLQEKLDNAYHLAEISKKDLHQAEKKVKNLNANQIQYMKTISSLEQKVKNYDSLIFSLNQQLTAAKKKASQSDSLRKEVQSMKDQMTSILSSTSKNAEKLVRNEKNPTKLALWISALKGESLTCEKKITDLKNELKIVNIDLRREIDLKMEQEERLSQLESENNSLTQKENLCNAEVKNTKKNLLKANKQIKNLKGQLKKCKNSDSHDEQDINRQSQNKAVNISLYVEKLKMEQQKLELSEVKRVELENILQNTKARLQNELDLRKDQEQIISELNNDIFELGQHLSWYEDNERKRLYDGYGYGTGYRYTRRVEAESNFGGFRIGLLVLGALVAFCIYRRN